jgi:hypothetical protein
MQRTCSKCGHGPQWGLNKPHSDKTNGDYLAVVCERCKGPLFVLPAYGPKPEMYSPHCPPARMEQADRHSTGGG